jgi:hypothetical protein
MNLQLRIVWSLRGDFELGLFEIVKVKRSHGDGLNAFCIMRLS